MLSSISFGSSKEVHPGHGGMGVESPLIGNGAPWYARNELLPEKAEDQGNCLRGDPSYLTPKG